MHFGMGCPLSYDAQLQVRPRAKADLQELLGDRACELRDLRAALALRAGGDPSLGIWVTPSLA